MHKQFKTIPEQIRLLKSRGLQIPDEKFAASFLLDNNYYRISGYSLTLRNNDNFYKNATFQNIVDIYNFDHEMRHILLKYIEQIEVKLKSVLTHEFSKEYGPFGYLNPDNFTDTAKHRVILAKSESLKAQRTPHEAYLKHFIVDLKSQVPMWAYVELYSISDISILYKISQENIKRQVSAVFNIPESHYKLLEKFMHSMTILRNLCAHGSRIYNRLFEQKPRLSKNELKLLRTRPDGSVDNAHLFSFILVTRRLLNPDQFRNLTDNIIELSEKYPFVSLTYYGFPENWSTILRYNNIAATYSKHEKEYKCQRS